MHTSKTDHHIIHHDPAAHTTHESPVFVPPRDRKPVIILAILGLFLIVIGAVWYFNGMSFNFNKEKAPETAYISADDSVFATVGAETLYNQDITYEQSFYPEAERKELIPAIKERLVEESIILQAGEAAGIIELTPEIFNSLDKDREKRRDLLAKVEETINNQAAYKKGAVISIWFMNYAPGPIGYEEGKKLALEKITAVHDAVENGTMTIKQAGETLKKDTSLAQVDSVYDNNAYFEFDTREKSEITYDEDFNQQLLALNPGETTAIYTGKDYEQDFFDQPKKDAVFMFGQVTEAETDGNLPFDAWLAQQRENYAVTEQ